MTALVLLGGNDMFNAKLIPKTDSFIIGYNIEDGSIISEKLYLYVDKRNIHDNTVGIANNEFIRNLLLSCENLRYLDSETESDQNSNKYDFQVESQKCYYQAKKYLANNTSLFDEKTIDKIESISWINSIFTTIGLRFSAENIIDLDVYYRRNPFAIPKLEELSFLPKSSFRECLCWADFLFVESVAVRLLAIDFQKTRTLLKIYFEAGDPNIIQRIVSFQQDTINYAAVNQLYKYSSLNNLQFGAIALVMDLKTDYIRYNYYFKVTIQSP